MPDRQSHIRLRRLVTAVVGVLAVAVTGAGLAWACTPTAELDDLVPAVGPAGTQVKVRGRSFPATTDLKDGYVKIFLDDRTEAEVEAGDPVENEPVLVKGPTDSHGCFPAGCNLDTNKDWGPYETITIPEGLSPGDHHKIIAVGYENARDIMPHLYDDTTQQSPEGMPMKWFDVTEPVPAGDNADNAAGDPAPEAPPVAAGDPPPEAPPVAAGADKPAPRPDPLAGLAQLLDSSSGSRSATSNRPTTGGSASRATAPASRAGAPSPKGGAPRESSNPGLVTSPSGRSLFEDSMPPAALTDARRFGQPSGRSASGDLWSGFGSGRMPSLEPRRSGDPAAEEAGGFDIGLAAGTGFLGLGLAALFGSFLVAEVRRRRKAVRA